MKKLLCKMLVVLELKVVTYFNLLVKRSLILLFLVLVYQYYEI